MILGIACSLSHDKFGVIRGAVRCVIDLVCIYLVCFSLIMVVFLLFSSVRRIFSCGNDNIKYKYLTCLFLLTIRCIGCN